MKVPGDGITALPFLLTSALVGGGWSMPHSGQFTPRTVAEYPLYRRVHGSQSQSRLLYLAPTQAVDWTPNAVYDIWEKRKIACSSQDLNHVSFSL